MLDTDKNTFMQLLEATFNYYDRQTNETVIEMYWEGLKDLDLPAVKTALSQHMRANKFMPKISCVRELIPDNSGYLLPNEAWETFPYYENMGGYVTQQAMSAAPLNLIDSGDMVAARMAFIEAYKREVVTAKAEGIKPKYFYSAPTDGSREQKQQIKQSSLLIARDKSWISEQRFSDLNSLLDQPISQNNPALNMLSQQTGDGLQKIGKKSSEPTDDLS